MEMTPRLKAGIFVRALIRRAEVSGASAFIVRKGNEEAGTVIIKLSKLDGNCLVLNQARDGKGELVWSRPLGDWGEESALAFLTAMIDPQKRASDAISRQEPPKRAGQAQ